MARVTTHASAGSTFSSPEGGTVTLSGEGADVPGAITTGRFGTAFGPLELTAYPGSTATLSNLTFEGNGGLLPRDWFTDDTSSDTDGNTTDEWFDSSMTVGAGGVGLLAGLPDGDSPNELSRRDLLKAGAGAALLGGTAGRAAATSDGEDLPTLTRASGELESNVGGVRLRVLDTGEGVMPADTVYYGFVDGVEYSTFAAGSGSYGDIPPSVSGEFKATDEDSILASIRAMLGQKAVEYEFDFGAEPSDASNGERLILTNHDMIVNALLDSGAGDSQLTIGSTSVPNRDEAQDNPRGWYGVRDGAVIYRVGSNPPAGTTATLTLYSSIVAETTDDADRIID